MRSAFGRRIVAAVAPGPEDDGIGLILIDPFLMTITSVAVFALLAALMAGLLRERRRRRTAETNAQQYLADLARLNRGWTIGELSGSIAHELTQPLSAILYNTEAAKGPLQDASPDLAELGSIIADIERDERRALDVINRLRGLFAKAPPDTREVDVNDVVREVFEFLSAPAAARDIVVTGNLAPQALHVRGDRIQLQQTILNLVVNGMDAIGDTSADRKITARTRVADGGASVDVAIEDSGPGIPADQLQQVFEPFFTTKPTGMGMGLSIARTILATHGGRIWAENRRGGGAVLRFRLPLAKTGRSSLSIETVAHPEALRPVPGGPAT